MPMIQVKLKSIAVAEVPAPNGREVRFHAGIVPSLSRHVVNSERKLAVKYGGGGGS